MRSWYVLGYKKDVNSKMEVDTFGIDAEGLAQMNPELNNENSPIEFGRNLTYCEAVKFTKLLRKELHG
jgi:hypothetical protein